MTTPVTSDDIARKALENMEALVPVVNNLDRRMGRLEDDVSQIKGDIAQINDDIALVKFNVTAMGADLSLLKAHLLEDQS